LCGQQTTDNGRGGNRLYETTDLWIYGMGEVSRTHCSRLVDCESAVGLKTIIIFLVKENDVSLHCLTRLLNKIVYAV
jgi:hypothetical protein